MNKTKKVVIDTSALLNNDNLIDELKDKYKIVLPIKVVEELDNIKQNSSNEDLKFRARQSIRSLDKNYDLIFFDLINKIEECFDEEINDNKIVSCAKRNNAMLVSDDMNLKVKACSLGIPCLEIKNEISVDTYNGIKNVVLSKQNLLYLYDHNRENIYDCETNQYLVVKNEDDEVIDKLKWNGTAYQPISFKIINNDFNGKIKPRNVEQELAFDLLQDSDITVKLIQGAWGGGKDLLMSAHAIDLVRKQKYDKIIWLRNNIEVKNSKQIGFLPGDKNEKLLPFASPLADNMGGFDGLQMWMMSGKIEVEHLGFIRGRTFNRCIVICSEAENTTKEHLQLIISRMGEDSQLWINGDIKQVDDRIYESNNGLKQCVHYLKGNRLFGTVELNTTERSETARLAVLLG